MDGLVKSGPETLSDFLALLQKNYPALSVRIRTLEHTTTSEHPTVTLRVHYPALRAGQSTVGELVDLIITYLVPFAMTRRECEEVHSQYGKIDAESYDRLRDKIRSDAVDLFKKVSRKTNRNGEGGELLLYLLTEWILGAPQILAKMPLKTNANMPVHGSDGVHVKVCSTSGKLMFIWGESKLWADVTKGINEAIDSLADALSRPKLQHEFKLIARNIDASGLSEQAKEALLEYLDPMSEKNNEWMSVTTCLICFDFKTYSEMAGKKPAEVEKFFRDELISKLPGMAKKFSDALKSKNLEAETVEVFFFPIPSVQEFRDLFQAAIGWNN